MLPAVPSTTVPPARSRPAEESVSILNGKHDEPASGLTSFLGIFDHVERGPVFDGPSGILKLCLAEDVAAELVRQPLEPDLRFNAGLQRKDGRCKCKRRTSGVLPMAPVNPCRRSS